MPLSGYAERGADMDDALLEVVLERLDRVPLEQRAVRLLLAAFEGDAALADELRGERRDASDRGAIQGETGPTGAYLRSVTVAGFRGIGPAATLELEPGPGLTVPGRGPQRQRQVQLRRGPGSAADRRPAAMAGTDGGVARRLAQPARAGSDAPVSRLGRGRCRFCGRRAHVGQQRWILRISGHGPGPRKETCRP